MRIYKRDISLQEWTAYLNSKDSTLVFSEFNHVDPWVEVKVEERVIPEGSTILNIDGKERVIGPSKPLGSANNNLGFEVVLSRQVGSHTSIITEVTAKGREIGFGFDIHKDKYRNTDLFRRLRQIADDLRLNFHELRKEFFRKLEEIKC